MERLTVTGTIGQITPETRKREDGTEYLLTIMRIAVRTNKRSRKTSEYLDMDTWYEISALGQEAEGWRRFSLGDGVVLSGIPYYEPYVRKDGTAGVQVYLQKVTDFSWTKGSKPREQREQEQQEQQTAYAGRAETQAPVPEDDDVF